MSASTIWCPTEFLSEEAQGGDRGPHRPELVIIARTNAVRVDGIDEALRRGEAFEKAGADMLFCYTRSPEELRFVGERLPPPLMIFAPPDGFAHLRAVEARPLPASASGLRPHPAPPSPPCTKR